MTTVHTPLDSPIGPLILTGHDGRLTGLHMGPASELGLGTATAAPAAPLRAARDQLERYFAGELTDFDLPLEPAGTDFQLRVWQELQRIPYGESVSYGELAARIGRPGAARAVGLANGRNPIAVIVPCHRVIGADGSLTGFGGGIERKRALLELEAGRTALAV